MPNATPIYTLNPAGLLDGSSPRITAHSGAPVQKIQPHGTPRNGVMGMCFVQHAETGEFIGQVCESSLKRTGRRQVPRDLAAEARDRANARRQSSRR
jgi:GMP synthase-like glutamine amidotransferase